MGFKEAPIATKAVLLDTRVTPPVTVEGRVANREYQIVARETQLHSKAVINMQVQAATKVGVKGHSEGVNCKKPQKHSRERINIWKEEMIQQMRKLDFGLEE